MISYTCAKTNVPIKAIEMGIGTDHPRHLVELRHWKDGALRKVRGHLVGEENCIKGIGGGFFLLDLATSGLHDAILAGDAFVLAANLCGEVPDDFRGRSYDDPAQGGLMMPEDLDEYIDERGHLLSYDVYMMLYCEGLSVDQARGLSDATLARLASVDAFVQRQIATLTDASGDWPATLNWSASSDSVNRPRLISAVWRSRKAASPYSAISLSAMSIRVTR